MRIGDEYVCAFMVGGFGRGGRGQSGQSGQTRNEKCKLRDTLLIIIFIYKVREGNLFFQNDFDRFDLFDHFSQSHSLVERT